MGRDFVSLRDDRSSESGQKVRQTICSILVPKAETFLEEKKPHPASKILFTNKSQNFRNKIDTAILIKVQRYKHTTEETMVLTIV